MDYIDEALLDVYNEQIAVSGANIIFLRKKFHNGDNTHPAIKKITAEMEQKLAFSGEKKI